METFAKDTSLNDTLKVHQLSIPPVGVTIFHIGLNTLLSITASVGNVLILIALRKGSSLHTPTKLLFRCLAVTDLLVGLILHPLHATGLVLDYLLKVTGHHVDDITFLVSFVFCGMSILISTAISVDRLLALLMMLKYKQVVTVRRVREAIVGFVLFVASIGLVYVFIGKIIALIITLILLVFTVVISSTSYIMIYFRLRHRVQLQDGISMNIAKFRKTVSSIAWVQLALVACYAPFGISVVLIKVKDWTGIIPEMVWNFAGTLVFFNSSLNPCLYCWKLREVRRAVKAIIMMKPVPSPSHGPSSASRALQELQRTGRRDTVEFQGTERRDTVELQGTRRRDTPELQGTRRPWGLGRCLCCQSN